MVKQSESSRTNKDKQNIRDLEINTQNLNLQV